MVVPLARRAFVLAAATALGVSSAGGVARAEPPDRAACLDAYVAAQDARKVGALLTARRNLEVCADDACPGMVQRDCARWLDEVSRALPSLVVLARDSAGRDVLDATATVDGASIRLDGRAVPLDPGKHVVLVRASSERREETVLLAEGERDRAIVVIFPAALGAAPAGGGASTSGSAPDASLAPTAPVPDASSRRVPTASWILGGLGVASLGVFGVFAWRGASDRASLGCDRGCPSESYSTVRRDYTAADVALGAGIALVGAAVVWWLVDGAPPRRSASSAHDRGAR